jgi:tight adherence protein B
MLLLLGSTFLMVFALSGLLLLKVQQKSREATSRITAVLGPHRPSWVEPVVTGGIGRAIHKANFSGFLFALLRYEPRRKVCYLIKLGPLVFLSVIPALVFGFVGWSFFRWPGCVAGPATMIGFCRAFHSWCETRTKQQLFTQFPDALATIVRTVRIGMPVTEAVRVVARESPLPTAREFNALVEQLAIGVPLDEALHAMANFSGLQEYRFFATALSLQSQTGGALAETLEKLAETIRNRVAIRLKGHALAAEARMSAYILGALPIVTGGLLLIFNPQYIAVLFTDTAGRMLLYSGMVLLMLGAVTMRKMIQSVLN